MDIFHIVDEYGKPINTTELEYMEQVLADKFILPDDKVLELGGRYGSVSCVINSKLTNRKNQVVIEPDFRVWDSLERNKIVNNCEFNIIKGFISDKKMSLTNLDDYSGYGTTSIEDELSDIPSYSLNEIKQNFNINFNVIVADCEGCLENFLNENPSVLDNIRLFIFEADYPEKCNYNQIREKFSLNGFVEVLSGHQNVWVKNS